MAPKLYMIKASPPVRAVQMTAKALDVELELEEVNILIGEHLQEKYLTINPSHTVPALDDDGFILWDSHAIMIYLVEKYGKNEDFYPKDPQVRSKVHQCLFFDAGTLFARGLTIIKLILQGQDVPQANYDALQESYDILEKIIGTNRFLAGDRPTIADFSTLASITSNDVLLPLDAKKYPKITAWINRVQVLPASSANVFGLEVFKQFMQSRLAAK